jgi:hypothetical protein
MTLSLNLAALVTERELQRGLAFTTFLFGLKLFDASLYLSIRHVFEVH